MLLEGVKWTCWFTRPGLDGAISVVCRQCPTWDEEMLVHVSPKKAHNGLGMKKVTGQA